MKGIILAGGSGTRLYPLTIATSKQMLPVYDKPMIYYPLYTMMTAGIREIMVISTPQDIGNFKKLLGDGRRLGIELSYGVQPSPDGLAQAFIIAEDFINGDACAMILGDNLLYGENIEKLFRQAMKDAEAGKSTIFGYKVPDPERFGVVEFDSEGNAVSIEEKPKKPKSDYCVIGLYFYNSKVCEYAKQLVPSDRGELEITDLNNIYLEKGALKVQLMDATCHWWDTGTYDSLMDAAIHARSVSKEKNRVLCSPEEVAYRAGWIGKEDLLWFAEAYKKTFYGTYLRRIAGEL